jgi:ATP-binding cassette subfamily F protein 3
MLIWQKPNLLLLDEPTNHLDLEMRHALTLALSEYEGAMVLVSHDRHLLRTTCDGLALVSGGGLKPFDGDLDDYRKWLDQPTENAMKATAGTGVSPQETAKTAAPKRASDRNLSREIEQLERRMAQLTEEKQRIDAQLADPATYQSPDKAALKKNTARQADLVRLLGEAEEKWLVLHEELEGQQGVKLR